MLLPATILHVHAFVCVSTAYAVLVPRVLMLLGPVVQVYFVGRCVAQKLKGNPHMAKSNHGYDDDRGDYSVVIHDHISYRMEVLSVLGKGSFGQVRARIFHKYAAQLDASSCCKERGYAL
jgi:hypothetical protein